MSLVEHLRQFVQVELLSLPAVEATIKMKDANEHVGPLMYSDTPPHTHTPHPTYSVCTLSRKVTQVGTNFSLLRMSVMLLCCVSGALVFQLKKRPPDYQGRKGRKVDDKAMRKDSSSSLPPEKLPYLVELSPGVRASRK